MRWRVVIRRRRLGILLDRERKGRLFKRHVLTLETAEHTPQVFVIVLGGLILGLKLSDHVFKLQK